MKQKAARYSCVAKLADPLDALPVLCFRLGRKHMCDWVWVSYGKRSSLWARKRKGPGAEPKMVTPKSVQFLHELFSLDMMAFRVPCQSVEGALKHYLTRSHALTWNLTGGSWKTCSFARASLQWGLTMLDGRGTLSK